MMHRIGPLPIVAVFAVLVVRGLAAAALAADGAVVSILEGHHHRLHFERGITRVAIGNPDVVDNPNLLSDREVLLLARKTGRTTLMVWFEDGDVDTQEIAVRRDFSVLEGALTRICADIHLEVAPDRDVLVLTGVVPDALTRRAAVEVAERYLAGADAVPQATDSETLIGESGQVQVRSPQPGPRGSVLDLLTVANLPATMEERLTQAIHSVGAGGIEVHRFNKGTITSDEDDLLVLTGSVATQSVLTRTLQVVSQLVIGKAVDPDDIVVLADESGALAKTNGQDFLGGQGNGSSGSNLSGGGAGLSNLFGNSSTSINSLGNRLGANLARATALSIAGGRILSFVEVRDLPQVRVDIRVYEVNRTDLKTYAPELDVLAADSEGFGDNVRAVLSFLADGFSQSAELTSGRFSVEAAFQLLESRGIARNLSGPSITVLSGERAQFLVGGEVPIPQNFSPAFGNVDAGDAVTPGVFSSVAFRPFGVQIGVRPLVGEEDRITLDLVTQVARPDAQLTTLLRETTGTDSLSTAFETRALRTSTRLADGKVLVLGGLIERRSADDASYTPGLESLPVIGWLFKRFSIQDEDLEVFVIVHPTVVRDPVEGVSQWLFPELQALAPNKN